MANVRSGNTHYVDSTGVISSDDNVRVIGVIVTATAANAVCVLSNEAGTTKKLDLRVASAGTSTHFNFYQSPVLFPKGVNVTTLANAIATVIYNTGGG